MMDCGSTILIFLAFIQATCGQSVTGPSAVQQGSDTVYTCTGGEAQNIFVWEDISVGTGVNIFVGGGPVADPMMYPKYVNFGVSENGGTSTMTISNTQIEDEGQYRCSIGLAGDDSAELTVDVKGTWRVSPDSPIKSNINDMFQATCEALEVRPNVTITWMLGDGASPCGVPVPTYPDAAEGLFSTRSVCTFQATSENNNGTTLTCVISGYLVPDLNGGVTATLDKHTSPSDAGTIVIADYVTQGADITVSCSVQTQPSPVMRIYSIFSNGESIHESMEGVNTVLVEDPIEGTNYTCMAGNYLGNTSLSAAVTYDPSRPTIPPTTALETTTKNEKTIGSGGRTGLSTTEPSTTSSISMPVDSSKEPTEPSANVAAIAGGVVAAIVIIVIIVIAVCYCKKQERFCFEAGGTPPPSNKPSGRAVGSSNGSGSEKEKLPQAAPRGHGSIQHTNDNPDQAMYAMVDKKPARGGGGAGDAPDRGSAPGQNEPQGMLYADLDLSHKAGHTDKHVPKNENDVVVYSSILV